MALPTINIENGTVVADPELRYTPSGKAVVNFRVAANSRRQNQQGEWENASTTFLTMNAWEGLAENIASTFSKGSKINVRGDLKQREYEKDGQNRTVFEVEAKSVSVPVPNFVNKGDGQQGNQAPQGGFTGSPTGGFGGGKAEEEPPF